MAMGGVDANLGIDSEIGVDAESRFRNQKWTKNSASEECREVDAFEDDSKYLCSAIYHSCSLLITYYFLSKNKWKSEGRLVFELVVKGFHEYPGMPYIFSITSTIFM